MASDIFDDLPDAFIEAFGEPVIYTPAGGTPVPLQAIWNDGSLTSPLGFDPAADTGKTRLSVRAADLTPAEGDTAQRLADGKVMNVAPPILPDGKGMVSCELTS